MSDKPKKQGFKKFPFAWRKAWLELGRQNPTAAYVWTYMWWRTDKASIFDLEESLVCLDIGLGRNALCKARSFLVARGGLERINSYNEKGQRIVTYRVVSPGTQIPENGTQRISSKYRKEVPSPDTASLDLANRYHTVDTVPVTPAVASLPMTPAIPESKAVDTSKPKKEVGREEAPPSAASLAGTSKAEKTAGYEVGMSVPKGEEANALGSWIESLFPGLLHTDDNLYAMKTCLIALHGIQPDHMEAYAAKLLEYNRKHQAKDHLIIRGPQKFAAALASVSEDSLMARERTHDHSCRTCSKLGVSLRYETFRVPPILCSHCNRYPIANGDMLEPDNDLCWPCINEGVRFETEPEPLPEPEPEPLPNPYGTWPEACGSCGRVTTVPSTYDKQGWDCGECGHANPLPASCVAWLKRQQAVGA